MSGVLGSPQAAATRPPAPAFVPLQLYRAAQTSPFARLLLERVARGLPMDPPSGPQGSLQPGPTDPFARVMATRP